MARTIDRIKALEALLASPMAEPANTFAVPMSFRLLSDYDAVIAETRARCGHLITPDAVPLVLDGDPQAWEQAAMRQQSFLIATGQESMARAAEREAVRIAAELAAKQAPKPQPKTKPTPTFVHHPNPFALART